MKSVYEGTLPSGALRFSPQVILRLLRVRDWCYLLGIAILALAKHTEMSNVATVTRVLAFSSVYLCWGYVFNNSFDQHEDSNEKNPFRVSEPSVVAIVTAILSVFLVALAILWGLAIPTLAVMALNFVYSAPPLRLKRHLVSALISNGVFFGFVYYAAVRLVTGFDLSGADVAFGFFVFSLFLPLQYVHHLEHREEAGHCTSMRHRAFAAAFFVVVAVASAVSGLVIPSSIYSLLGMITVARSTSASRMRVELRWLSACFGLVLLALFAL